MWKILLIQITIMHEEFVKISKKKVWVNIMNYIVIFRKMCLEIYILHPGKFISIPGSAWQIALEKSKVKIE